MARTITDKLQDRISYPPRGLRAERAAAYLGMSKSTFLELVADGRLPKPKHLRGVVVWDRLDLEAAFEALGTDNGTRKNTMDAIYGLDKE